MSRIILENLMLDSEMLGLADELIDIDEPFTVVVSSDEEPEIGREVFFGAELPFGDIGEVKGRVLAYEKTDGDIFVATIRVLALDNRYIMPLIKFLKDRDAGEDDTEKPEWGIGLRQTNGAFATIVNCPAGLLNTAQIAKIAEITGKGAGLAKLTHAQRIVLLLKPEQLETVQAELESVGLRVGVLHRGIRNIRGCCGALCKWAQGIDGLALSLETDKALFGRPSKFDVKIAISDCSRNCMESHCSDIGLIGNEEAYDVFVGGASSSVHFKGLKLVSGIRPEHIIPLLKQILGWYENIGEDGERLYKTLERVGYPEIKGKTNVFAPAAAMFATLDIGMDISSDLERSLARSYGVLKMRGDLRL